TECDGSIPIILPNQAAHVVIALDINIRQHHIHNLCSGSNATEETDQILRWPINSQPHDLVPSPSKRSSQRSSFTANRLETGSSVPPGRRCRIDVGDEDEVAREVILHPLELVHVFDLVGIGFRAVAPGKGCVSRWWVLRIIPQI